MRPLLLGSLLCLCTLVALAACTPAPVLPTLAPTLTPKPADTATVSPSATAVPQSSPTVAATPTNTDTQLPTATDTPAPTTTLSPFFLVGPFSLTLTSTVGQQYTRTLVSFLQPPDAVLVGIVASTTYTTTHFADAATLGSSYSLHGASSNWEGPGWFCLEVNWSQAQGACAYAAHALGDLTFKTPRGTSVRAEGWPGQTVASAFGIESICCAWPEVRADLVVYYVWRQTLPTPTAVP